MRSLNKFGIVIFIPLLISACSKRTNFEYIKIDAKKIIEARNATPVQRDSIKNINLNFDLKEIKEPIYYQSPEAYRADDTSSVVKPKSISKKPKSVIKPKPQVDKKVLNKLVPGKESDDFEELNGALKIPKKIIEKLDFKREQ